jgi:hypothetical protein
MKHGFFHILFYEIIDKSIDLIISNRKAISYDGMDV